MKKISSLLLSWIVFIFCCSAQDVIKTKNQEYRGKIKSADSKGVTIEIPAQGSIVVPRSVIVDLTMSPPPNIAKGIAAYKKGDYKEAQANLAMVVRQFPGLDTDWAAAGIDYYGRACLMTGDIANAAKAFTIFLEAYDETHPLAMDAEIGLAETDTDSKNFVKALPKFQELAAEFDKQVKPPNDQFPYAAAVFLGLGKCLEAQNDLKGALNAYLKVVALYPADNALPETFYRLAALYERQNKPEEAAIYLNDLASQFPSSPYSPKAAELKKKIEPRLKAEKKATAEK